ncbi:hypothetical protein PTET_b0227 [Pseudoalteromonas tetraodonis]|nr:hypothetical protein PTET_b0227 [Pseudoalteromonas tetraodonis]
MHAFKGYHQLRFYKNVTIVLLKFLLFLFLKPFNAPNI